MNPLYLYPQYPPLINLIVTINTFIMIGLVLIIIYKKIKMMGAVRTTVFWNDGTHEIKNYLVKDGELQIRPKGKVFGRNRQWTPKIRSEHIIPCKKNFKNKFNIPFAFTQKDMVLAIEGSPECVPIKGLDFEEIEESTKIMQSKLIKVWSVDEIKQFISKTLAKGMASRKVFNDTQFYIFMGLQVGVLVLLFMMAQRMGIF